MPNFFSPRVGDSMPVGSVIMYGGATAPSGWVLCDGTAYSRTVVYDALFAVLSTTYGVGDGANTFNVPDARGVFVRGAGTQTISTISYTGTRGTTSGDAMQGHRHNMVCNTVTTSDTTGANDGDSNSGSVRYAASARVLDPVTDGSNGTPRLAAETKPANITLSYIIKAF